MTPDKLKKIYYSLLASDPDYPAWEEFEYHGSSDCWHQFKSPILHSFFDNTVIRHNPKPKKWQPVSGGVIIDLGNDEINLVNEHRQDAVDNFTENGLVRTNKEQAEQDLAQIRQFCRFLAWRAENCKYSDEIVPVTNYAGCFLDDDDYYKLVKLVNSGEMEL